MRAKLRRHMHVTLDRIERWHAAHVPTSADNRPKWSTTQPKQAVTTRRPS